MASWFLSWLPGLPSINLPLPSSIQRRFISFVLKKSLGHLLKPGQLDVNQIDSQIGAGYVQVSDLELDTQAVNDLVSGLPVKLVEGSIGSITARIPWPNPLTSEVGVSLDALHLTLHLLQPSQQSVDLSSSQHLSESVASISESFIHDELTPREEASLRASFHGSDFGGDSNVPGGLDPFLSVPEDQSALEDLDPAGVSVFATLIERLLARFKFDAVNTSITLVHLEHTSVTVNIDELHYRTEPDLTDEDASREGVVGQVRSVSVSGVSLSTKDLRPPAPISPLLISQTLSTACHTPFTPRTPRSASPASSSSSIDEDTQWAMSQSLAALPPRAPSPASSVTSSMYQSAVSMAPDQSDSNYGRTPTPPVIQTHSPLKVWAPSSDIERVEPPEDTVLCLGTDPIVLKLTTPPVQQTGMQEKVQLSLTMGIVACAFRAWHFRGILDMLNHVTPHSSSEIPTASPSPTLLGMGLAVSIDIRGFVGLVLPSVATKDATDPTIISPFFTHPLSPLRLRRGYVRAHLEHISTRITLGSLREEQTRSSSITANAIFSISDVSAFVIRPCVSDTSTFSAAPLLITDPHVSSQYSTLHVHPDPSNYPDIPSFSVTGWTADDIGLKPSFWRTKTRHNRDDSQTAPSASGKTPQKPKPAVAGSITTSDKTNIVDVDLASLHFFIDLAEALDAELLSFLNEISAPDAIAVSQEAFADDNDEDSGDYDANTPPVTPHAVGWDQEVETERQRLVDELGLDFDYTSPKPKVRTKSTASAHKRPVFKSKDIRSHVTVGTAMVRFEVRCPPLPNHSPRSGSLVLDCHDLKIDLGQPPVTTIGGTRFNEDHPSPLTEDTLVSVDCNRLLLGYSPIREPRASMFLSVGSLHSADDAVFSIPLRPRIRISQKTPPATSSSLSPPTLVLDVNLPSVHGHFVKAGLDGLQYWADDASQLIERTFSGDPDAERVSSRDASIIGSRFFARSSSGSGVTAVPPATTRSETVVSVTISEAFVRSLVSREEEFFNVRPFDLIASGCDALIKVKPLGKDETVVIFGAMDVIVTNATGPGRVETLLSLTSPRSLMAVPTPLVKLQFTSLVVPETTAKESRVKLSLWGFTYSLFSDISWISDLARFAKAPPGAFESVLPSERTVVSLKIVDGSTRVVAPSHPGALVLHVGELDFTTSLAGASRDTAFKISVPSLCLLGLDNVEDAVDVYGLSRNGLSFWKKAGFATIANVQDLELRFQKRTEGYPNTEVVVDRIVLGLHLCADTMSSVESFMKDLVSAFNIQPDKTIPQHARGPAMLTDDAGPPAVLSASMDDFAYKQIPEVGPAPDMIDDDLPSNLDYLDESFGTAAGLRELRDDDLEDFSYPEMNFRDTTLTSDTTGIVSKVGGETIKMLRPEGLHVIEHYFDTLSPDTSGDVESGETTLSVRVHNADINVGLYDGYDWAKTRKAIEEEVKEMRKRLTKIKQLVSTGQNQDTNTEDTRTLLFNSVYIGLDRDMDELEPGALLTAIDEELKEEFETISQSSWQSLRSPAGMKVKTKTSRFRGKRLTRSKGPSIEIRIDGLEADIDQCSPVETTISRLLATIKDLEILDHIKTSTWSKFLTQLRSDSQGNIRETGSNMVKVELRTVRPEPGHPSEEARLRAKILPLRLYVDQDALDFLKKFFSFKDPDAVCSQGSEEGTPIFFQLAEIFPVELKLDYKPRRVDYRALREGRTIELMNFFHFDGAEMTLRHITLAGITGWPKLFDLLNDLWTPDVKATQLVDVISGVSPIRSVVNVGSGIADLVLLPIAQYKKDGRVVRGVQKGATAFVKSTATEAIKLGARLATGTQVILEQAEGVLGGQFTSPITAETLQSPIPGGADALQANDDFEDEGDLISKYAEQPADVQEGVQFAYKSLRRNLNSAAQTILAVPMEVYERSGNEGPVRSVIRAVPIAVLKPMIGASEAVSKTLLGLHNTLDPNLRYDNDAKYKHR